jgi:hypothetical protein
MKPSRSQGAFLSVVLVTVLGLLALGGTPAQAAVRSSAPTSASSGETRGRLLSLLSAKWWQWGLSQPASRSPLTDTTGRFCAQGQRGHIWFLAGNFNGSPASPISRHCTVPAGKALFFPLVNQFSGYQIGVDPADLDSVAAQRAIVAATGIQSSTGLSVMVDGRSARFAFEESVPFKVLFPPKDNLFGLTHNLVLKPTVDAGYYSYLRPLCPGRHKIVFTGIEPGQRKMRTTYYLTVRG